MQNESQYIKDSSNEEQQNIKPTKYTNKQYHGETSPGVQISRYLNILFHREWKSRHKGRNKMPNSKRSDLSAVTLTVKSLD